MSNQNPAISPLFEAFYIQSMLFNATSAMESISRLTDVLEALEGRTWEETREVIDQQGLLDQLQNVVLQGGSLSRYFWPANKTYAARGEQLRVGLGLTDSSPLKDRRLRNSLEHFDERLDTYLSQNIVGYFLPQFVGPTPKHNQVPLHLFRGYYLDTGIFTLLGDDYEMQPLVDEIASVYDALLYSDEQGGQLQQRPSTNTADS